VIELRGRCLVLAALAVAACHRSAPADEAAGHKVALIASAAPEDAVVATVDERPIRASEIAVAAKASGKTAKEALDDLVSAEALVSEASRRGLDASAVVQGAETAEAVRRFLELEFEPSVRAEDVPLRAIKRAWEKNKWLLDHSEYVDVWHILVPSKDTDPPEAQRRAEALAREIQSRAKKVTSVQDFQAIASDTKLPETIPRLVSEELMTARDGWTVKEFSYPAHDQLKVPGDVSEVVKTAFGFHVIYLIRRIPPSHTTFEAAVPELRAGLLTGFQSTRFTPFVDALMQKHDVRVFPERLGAPEAPKAPSR
jgi:peptidyl-prolyl cis-trans isomerase C